MDDKWFRWEREATVNLLFPTIEVFFEPLRQYTGVKAPPMAMIFKKGIVTVCIPQKGFYDFGKELLEIYKNPKEERDLIRDVNFRIKDLKRVERKISKLKLKTLTDLELKDLYKELYSAFLHYYIPGSIGTPLSLVAEDELKKAGLTDEQVNSLTTPKTGTYTAEAEEFLRKGGDIEEFIEKYFWLENNYSGTKVLTKKEVRERLRNLKPVSVQTNSDYSKIKLTKSSKRLVELLKHYAIYKDDRKKNIFIYLHFLDSILKEIARRKKYSLLEVRGFIPEEVELVLEDNFKKDLLKKRRGLFVVAWNRGDKRPRFLTGSAAEEWERKSLVVVSDKTVVKGNVACGGKVTGKVRILLRADDSDKFKKGEVLVTFMTSPDFMPAIRKASAIVTNLGGVTSHAAIISRELNIPCIVGTKIATQVLKNGDLVEVDADNGKVKVLGF